MSIFSNLFAQATAVINGDNNLNSVNLEAEGKFVKVKFSISDVRKIELTDDTELTVSEVIKSAATLGNINLTGDYTVLENGKPVELDKPYINRATYSLTFNAGEAG